MHDVTETFDFHELAHVHGTGHGHLGEVVAGQIHEHEVLRAFLLVREQIVAQRQILLHGGPARTRTRDRVRHGLPSGHGDQGFR